jgi:PAS domain S-box-containing protein
MGAGPAGEGLSEIADLKTRLAEAEDTLRALRSGEVDALVVDGQSGPQVFTLKSAAEPYRLLVEQMREGALTLSLQGVILYCNGAFACIIGRTAPLIIGSHVLDYMSERDFKHLADHKGCRGCEMSIRRDAGGYAPVTVSSVALAVDGQSIVSAVVTDLSGHQLRLRHEAIVTSVGVPIYSLSPDLIVENWNPGAEAFYGYAPHEIVGQPVRILCSSDDECKAFEAFATEVAQCGHALTRDTRRLRKDGSSVDVILCLAPLQNRDGVITGYAAITHDISERKAQERTRQLLLDELNHRVKNTLAMVQSIARLTLRQTKNPEDFANSFTGRIQALSGAHDVLTASSWHGADVASLVRDQLILGDTSEGRFSCCGPSLNLDPQTAVALSLVLHELGTNASKYGALSVASGNVDLSWESVESGEALEMRWRELGGPTVAEPTRRGFGTFIIEQSLRGLDGEANIRFEPAGVVCDMSIPIRKARHPTHEKP